MSSGKCHAKGNGHGELPPRPSFSMILEESNEKSPARPRCTRATSITVAGRTRHGRGQSSSLPPSNTPVFAANAQSTTTFEKTHTRKNDMFELTTMINRSPCCRRLMADGVAPTPPSPAGNDQAIIVVDVQVVDAERNGTRGP